MNEGVFPAPPEESVLLTDADRTELEKQGVSLSNALATTRAGNVFTVTWPVHERASDGADFMPFRRSGKTLNPSPFLVAFETAFPAA